MASQLDQHYGAFPNMNGHRFYVGGTGGPDVGPGSGQAAAINPAMTNSPAGATMAPSKPIVDEPGAGTAAAFSPASLLENPATWLVVTLGLAFALARYSATGSVL